jgi:hypothetical protein
MPAKLRRKLRRVGAATFLGVLVMATGGAPGSTAYAHGTGNPTPTDGELLLGTPPEILVELPGDEAVELELRRAQDDRSIPFTGTVERTDGLVRATPPVLEHGTYILEWTSPRGSGWSTFSVGKTDTVVSSRGLAGRPWPLLAAAGALLALGVILGAGRRPWTLLTGASMILTGAVLATPPNTVTRAGTFILLLVGVATAATLLHATRTVGRFRVGDGSRTSTVAIAVTAPLLTAIAGASLLRNVPVNPFAPATLTGYLALAVVVAVVLPVVAVRATHALRDTSETDGRTGTGRTRARALPGLLVGVTLLGAGAVMLPVDARLGTLSEETKPAVSCLTGSNRLEIQRCLDASLVATARSEGITAALDTLRDLLPVDGRARYFCHEASHAIGRESLAFNGNLADAFRDGYDVCDFGYYHGIVEGAAGGFDDERFLASVPTLCEEFASAEELFYMQCNHGIGHAAARRTNNDMVRALGFCDALDVNPNLTGERLRIARNGCGTGVTMEWFATATADPNAATTPRVSRPRDVCTVVPDSWATECVEYVGNTLDASDPVNSLNELGTWCETTRHVDACYRGLARAAAGVGIPARDAIGVCENADGRQARDECITFYIAAVATTIDYDVAAVERICRELPDRDRTGPDALCERVRGAVIEVLAAGDGKNRN